MDQPVGKRGLAVVDMSNDAEISNVVHNGLPLRTASYHDCLQE
jgi:hypothetical protein